MEKIRKKRKFWKRLGPVPKITLKCVDDVLVRKGTGFGIAEICRIVFLVIELTEGGESCGIEPQEQQYEFLTPKADFGNRIHVP